MPIYGMGHLRNFMQIIKIDHPELMELLEKKRTDVDEGRKISGEIDDLEKKRNKLAMHIQQLKDQIIPLVEKVVEGKLTEFEQIEGVEVVDGQVCITTFNAVEEFKRDYIQRMQQMKEAAQAEKNQPVKPDGEQKNETAE